MALYDGLPLNTPTFLGPEGDVDVWATRTPNGGTIERRVRAGTDTDAVQQREARITAAVPVLRQWAADARGTTVTAGNVVAVTQTLVNRLGIFFDQFADLLQSLNKG